MVISMKKKKFEVGEEVYIDYTLFHNNIAPLTTTPQLIEEYEKKLENEFNIEPKENS